MTVATPAGHEPSTVLVSGTDSDPNTSDGQNHNSGGAVVSVGSESNYTIDFGFMPEVELGSIGDQIWGDDDGMGAVYSATADSLLSGVVITLTPPADVDLGAGVGVPITTTTVNGAYLFDNLPAGTYTVMVDTTTLPVQYLTTPSNSPDGDNSSVVTIGGGNPLNNLNQDFSYPPLQETAVSLLDVFVNDADQSPWLVVALAVVVFSTWLLWQRRR